MRRALALATAVTLGVAGLTLASPAAVAAPAHQASDTAHEAVPDELLVGYVAGASASDKERARGRASARLIERVVSPSGDRREVERVNISSGRDRGAVIAELQRDPSVAYAEPNWILQADAAASPNELVDLWGMGGNFGSNAVGAWAGPSTGSSAIYVGIVDEGVDPDHPDLLGRVDKSLSQNFAGQNSNAFYVADQDDHGTHVAGTIGATQGNGGVVGVNWDVRLISAKFLGPQGGYLSDAVEALDYLTGLKATLNIVATNNSWGGGGFSQSLLDAIERGADAGILFVAAAGNSGTNNDKKASYPSNYDTAAGTNSKYDAVIAVAAIDTNGAKPRWSQYGARTVDLGAPGVNIKSTLPYNTWGSYSGTSMATPHVTGAIALYAAAKGLTTTTTAVQAKAMRKALLDAAVYTPSLAGKVSTSGRLDIARAIAGP